MPRRQQLSEEGNAVAFRRPAQKRPLIVFIFARSNPIYPLTEYGLDTCDGCIEAWEVKVA